MTILLPPRNNLANPQAMYSHVTGANFLINASETIAQEEVLASMGLFASEVMPRFQDKEPASQAASSSC